MTEVVIVQFNIYFYVICAYDRCFIELYLAARDILAWEYVPLGPFLGKNFGKMLQLISINVQFLLKKKMSNWTRAVYIPDIDARVDYFSL